MTREVLRVEEPDRVFGKLNDAYAAGAWFAITGCVLSLEWQAGSSRAEFNGASDQYRMGARHERERA